MWSLYYYMLDEYIQFMNKRYRILKGQSRMDHPDIWLHLDTQDTGRMQTT